MAFLATKQNAVPSISSSCTACRNPDQDFKSKSGSGIIELPVPRVSEVRFRVYCDVSRTSGTGHKFKLGKNGAPAQ
jgi:hypothetical protein